jgi:hypothetical protein
MRMVIEVAAETVKMVHGDTVLLERSSFITYPSVYALTTSLGLGFGKAVYKEFTTRFGITPSVALMLWNAKMLSLWVNPVCKYKNYTYSYSGKIDPNLLRLVTLNFDMMESYLNDGLEHLMPFAMYSGLSPQALKTLFGKSLWKALCANSKTRNLLLCKVAYGSHTQILKERFEVLRKFPSKYLRRGRNTPLPFDDIGVYFLQKGLEFDNHQARRIYDTRLLASGLGAPFNLNWSLRRMDEMHSKYSKLVNKRKYSSEIFPWLSNVESEFFSEGYHATLLRSMYDIQNEGVEMGHCVAGYAGAVSRGIYLVFSVLYEDVRSTVGLHVQANKWKVQQHYGRFNEIIKSPRVDEFLLALTIHCGINIKREDKDVRSE